MMAQFLIFISWTVESIFLTIGFIIVIWMDTPPQLANDMSILYTATTTAAVKDNHSAGASRTVRSVTSLAMVLT